MCTIQIQSKKGCAQGPTWWKVPHPWSRQCVCNACLCKNTCFFCTQEGCLPPNNLCVCWLVVDYFLHLELCLVLVPYFYIPISTGQVMWSVSQLAPRLCRTESKVMWPVSQLPAWLCRNESKVMWSLSQLSPWLCRTSKRLCGQYHSYHLDFVGLSPRLCGQYHSVSLTL